MKKNPIETFASTPELKRKTRQRARQLHGPRGKSKYLRGLIERDFDKGMK